MYVHKFKQCVSCVLCSNMLCLGEFLLGHLYTQVCLQLSELLLVSQHSHFSLYSTIIILVCPGQQ